MAIQRASMCMHARAMTVSGETAKPRCAVRAKGTNEAPIISYFIPYKSLYLVHREMICGIEK